LISPAILEDELPLNRAGAELIARARQELGAIIEGRDDRLIVVVGPCSIHDPAAALDYADRLCSVIPRYAPDLLIAMRVYFEKPRTVVGWKGLINDPLLDQSFQINLGLRFARKLLLDVTARGLPIANEFLDTILGQYYAELVSWGAIGARTVESQVHRELASGLSMPVGFKNRTDGDLHVAIDAIRSARQPHWFPSLTREGAPAVLGTTGNEQCHLVLRGGTRGPNFSAEQVNAAAELLRRHALPSAVMVDCSHANSGKDPERQPEVAAEIAAQLRGGQRALCGVMLESNLLGGAQPADAKPLAYGRSITDGCLAWEKTVPVLSQLAEAVQARRKR
jgi:3-deoxy-7-phosphoheptulonate synthase